MVCPYVDRGDKRCQESFRLENVDRAIHVCGDRFATCPIFQRIYAREGFSLRRLFVRTMQTLHLL